MASFDALLSVGRIRKAHGLRGEVVVRLSTNRVERVDPGSRLFTEFQELTVVKARPKDADFLVLFDGLSSREDAESLRGLELRAEPLDDPDELWVHELIGATVVDRSGVQRGAVVEVHANPASDLLALEDETLIPATFIVAFTPGAGETPGRVEVDVPDGLFEL